MAKLNDPVLMAKIGAPHGVRGELRVTSFTDNPQAFGDYGKLSSKDGHSFTVSKSRPAKNVLVVSFKEIQNREDAEKVRGLELFIERDNLPDTTNDEFYIQDLVGMLVLDDTKSVIGKIQDIPNFGAGHLLEIAPKISADRFSSNTWYLAFTKDNVPEIDMNSRQVFIIQPSEISERDE